MWKRRREKEQVEELTFPAPRDGLPEDPRPFVGSVQQRMAGTLLEQMSSHGLLAVVGPLGSGKSTLVARAANSRWARQWFLQDEGGQPVHRRFWADLERCRPGAETEERIARALGRPTFGKAMARLGNGKPSLLVLDNADRALSEEGVDNPVLDQLSPFVERGATVVVTARDVASMSADRQWAATMETAALPTDEEAKQLFDQLAPEHAGHWLIPQLVGRCQRLPLAVTLLGRLAVRFSPDQIAAVTSLGQSNREADADDGSGLRFVLDLASSLLPTEERRVWAGLALFPAGLSGAEIIAVLGEIPDARNGAVRLHDLGLAQRCDAGVRIPDPLRLDASAAGLDPGGVSGLWRRYVNVGHEAVTSNGVDRWLVRQQANLDQLAARPPLADGLVDLACGALLAHKSGHRHDSLDATLVRLAQAGTGNGPPPAVLAATAATLLGQGRFDTAVLIAAVNVDGQRGREEREAEADALALLGRAETGASRYHDAARHLKAALIGYEELANVPGQATTHLEIGQVELARGRLDDAEQHLTEALAAFGEIGRPIGQANTRLELVRVDLARGHHDMAQLHLGDARTSFEEAGDRVGQSNAELQLGQVDLAAGRLDDAERHLVDALSGYESAGDGLGRANANLQLGQVDLVRGRLATADRRLRDALTGYEEVGDRVGQAGAGMQLGQIDLATGRHGAAEGRFGDALAGYQLIGDRLGQANASLQLAQVSLARDQVEEAGLRLADAQDGYDEIGDRLGQANCRHLIAVVAERSGARADAVADFDEAAAIYARIGRLDSAGWNLASAARCSTGEAQRKEYAARAVAHLQQAGLAEEAARIADEFDDDVPEEPVGETPDDKAAVAGTPGGELAVEEAVVVEAAVVEAAAGESAVEEAPAVEAPAGEPAVEEAPAIEAPAVVAAVEEAAAVEEVAPVEEVAAEVPEEGASAVEAPVDEGPEVEMAAVPSPVRKAPVRKAPVRKAPVRKAPVRKASVRKASVEEAAAVEAPPALEAPVNEQSAGPKAAVVAPAMEVVEEGPEKAAVDEGAVSEIGVEEIVVEEAPVGEAPDVEAPAIEAPADEVAFEEAVVEEAPVGEAPDVEAPAIEAPATEAPAEAAVTGTDESAARESASDESASDESAADGISGIAVAEANEVEAPTVVAAGETDDHQASDAPVPDRAPVDVDTPPEGVHMVMSPANAATVEEEERLRGLLDNALTDKADNRDDAAASGGDDATPQTLFPTDGPPPKEGRRVWRRRG